MRPCPVVAVWIDANAWLAHALVGSQSIHTNVQEMRVVWNPVPFIWLTPTCLQGRHKHNPNEHYHFYCAECFCLGFSL